MPAGAGTDVKSPLGRGRGNQVDGLRDLGTRFDAGGLLASSRDARTISREDLSRAGGCRLDFSVVSARGCGASRGFPRGEMHKSCR